MHKGMGIILKNYAPHKKKISLLDYNLGKISAIASKYNSLEKASTGFCLEYDYINREKIYLLESINIVQVPFYLAKNNIFFLHQILELCYYILPENCSSKEVFNWVYFLLNLEKKIKYHLYKKIFLVKLFSYMGIHPENSIASSIFIHQLMQKSFEDIENDINADENNVLQSWLTECIKSHPKKNHFETIVFERDDYKHE